MTLALRDVLFDAQFVRALAYTGQGGAGIGDCFGTAARITKTDADLWHDEWFATARVAAVHRVSARGAYLRASNYSRTAGICLMATPVDDRLPERAGE